MNSTLSILAYIISGTALCISIINYFRISMLKEHTARTHLLINDILIAMKEILKVNEEFVKDIKLKTEEGKDDGHTICSNRTTKKTRQSSNKWFIKIRHWETTFHNMRIRADSGR